jgi:hypothetical protein
MTVNSLTIRGGTNIGNVLLLNFFGTAVPLTVLNGLTNADGGHIVNLNSALLVQAGPVILTNTEFIQDGGFVRVTNISMNFNASQYHMTNGVFDGGTVWVGAPVPSQFNQYGGTATIANLLLGTPTSGSGGAYFLSGGNLNLPGGLTLEGGNGSTASYFQSGGTNRTTQVLIEPGIFGAGLSFTLSGGLLADDHVDVFADNFGVATLEQDGGTHFVTNALEIAGGAANLNEVLPAAYQLNGGALFAGSVSLNGNPGDADFTQTSGTAQVGDFEASSGGPFEFFTTAITLSGGALMATNLLITDGGTIVQSGGALAISNTLNVIGFTEPGPTIYTRYTFLGGTLYASNINIGGDWFIGDSSGTNRISNPGVISLSQAIVISNAVEQLGSFILVSNASINLAGSASRLSFADSSGQTWANGAVLVVSNWNGNASGGGAGQLKFGTSQSGLTATQLNQIQFQLGTNSFPAQILATGEVVPNQGVAPSGPVNSWTNPVSGNWDQVTNWSAAALPNSSQTVMITNSGYKAVAINPTTPINFSNSMTVNTLTIRGATNSGNQLLLNFFGTAVPLTVLTGLTCADNGQIANLNSSLIVQSGTFVISNTTMIQDGGFVRATNVQMQFFSSEYYMTSGVFEAGSVLTGIGPGHFNQFGGTVTIASLSWVFSFSGGSGDAGYILHGGTLNLPGGLSLQGEGGPTPSYFQDGGTNHTTDILMEPGLSGPSPHATVNGGLLTDNNVDVLADTIFTMFLQNGGTHIVSNVLQMVGGARVATIRPAVYQMNGGTLSASNIVLNAGDGDARFIQTNGTTHAREIQASSSFADGLPNSADLTLMAGTLTSSNLVSTFGANIHQFGGTLVVSNSLVFGGFRDSFIGPVYSRYEFFGGTLTASNITMDGDWIIGDSSGTNRISNPGFISLSHTILISNAVEQLGSAILASNLTINLAGSASRLSFSNSSAESWAGGAIIVVSNWNGNLSGGGAEQLKFGTSQSGLTAAQLNQIQFQIGSNIFTAKILNTGEVVPGQLATATIAFSHQANNIVLNWPQGWTLQTATNVGGPYSDVLSATSPFTNDTTLDPQQFFRLRQ